jgi:hypothetical protein
MCYIVVFDRNYTKFIYSTNTQQDAFLKDCVFMFLYGLRSIINTILRAGVREFVKWKLKEQ